MVRVPGVKGSVHHIVNAQVLMAGILFGGSQSAGAIVRRQVRAWSASVAGGAVCRHGTQQYYITNVAHRKKNRLGGEAAY